MNNVSANSVLSKKNWRALTYDWNLYNQYSDDSCLVCLTEKQLAWLQSNVDYYSWSSRWKNLGITQEQLSDEASSLEYALMSCINIQPYQIEFNYNQTVDSTLEAYNDAYTLGGIAELNPDTPTDFYSGDGSQERLNALCTATNIYIRSYASNWITKAQATLNVTVVIAVALSLTGVGGVIAGTVLAGLAFITQTALNAMQDSGAIDDVICCMYNELIGEVINNALFITSLDNCGFVVGSNQAIIRDIIASDLPVFNNWLSFINSVGDAFVLAQVGIVDCPCVSTEAVTVNFNSTTNINYDLSVDNFLINIVEPIDLQSTVQGNPIPSGKMAFGTIAMSGDLSFNGWIRITLPTPKDLTNLSFDYFYKLHTAGTSVFRQISLFDINDVLISTVSSTASSPQNTWNNFSPVISGLNVSYIRVAVAQSYTSGSPAPATDMGWIDNVTWTQPT